MPRRPQCAKRILLLAAALAVLTDRADSVTTFIYEPSPYLGSFDSPFYGGIQAGTIYLEDFEDGELNTPFVIANDINHDPSNRWISRTVHTANPSARAYSVDEDDGLLGDFMGFGGDALANRSVGSSSDIHEFLFSPDALGNYPKFVGFVVTDPEDYLDEDVFVTMLDPDGNDVLEEERFDPSDWPFQGSIDTRSHRFIGGYSDTGIASLRIEGVDQLDHLQYGSAIPEPSAWLLSACGFVLLILRRSR